MATDRERDYSQYITGTPGTLEHLQQIMQYGDAPLENYGYVLPQAPSADLAQYNHPEYMTMSPYDYSNFMYGSAPTTLDYGGQQYFYRDPSQQPIQEVKGFYDPSFDFGDAVLMGMTAVAGAGLGGMLPGTTNAFAGGLSSFAPTMGESAFPSIGMEMGSAGLGGATSGLSGGAGALADASWGINPQTMTTQTGAYGINGGYMPAGTNITVNPFSASELGTFGQVGAGGSALGAAGGTFPVASTASAFGPSAAMTGAEMAGTFGSIPMGSYGWDSFLPGGNLAGSAATGGLGGIGSGIMDFLKSPLANTLLGKVAPAALGAYGASQQADAYGDMFNKYFGMGEPYRNLLQQSYQPGFDISKEPGYQNAMDTTMNTYMRAASAGNAQGVASGNPFDNPGAFMESQKYLAGNIALPYLQNYRSGLSSAGQLGMGPSAQFGGAQIGAQGGVYDSIGYGLGEIFNPKPDYTKQFMNLLGGKGLV
jgi:hypothetical protein